MLILHVQTGAAHAKRHIVDVSGIAVGLEAPSLLQPSKDFPSPYVADRIDLDRVDRSISLFAGAWDGPGYQLMSVTGTLEISFSVKPWPEEAIDRPGCQAKVRAIAEGTGPPQGRVSRGLQSASA